MKLKIPFLKYLEILKRLVPIKTGALSNSWRTIEMTDSYAIFGSDSKYARIQDLGGQIPDRYPVNAKALHFFINGKEIYTKKAKGFTLQGKHYTANSFAEWMRSI